MRYVFEGGKNTSTSIGQKMSLQRKFDVSVPRIVVKVSHYKSRSEHNRFKTVRKF